jgi:hypothetical protein
MGVTHGTLLTCSYVVMPHSLADMGSSHSQKACSRGTAMSPWLDGSMKNSYSPPFCFAYVVSFAQYLRQWEESAQFNAYESREEG